MVQLLLNSAAIINQATADGATPLCMAVQEGHLLVVQLLLGCRVANQAMTNGSTPIVIAAIIV